MTSRSCDRYDAYRDRARKVQSFLSRPSCGSAHIRRCFCGKFERGCPGVNLSWAQLPVLPLVTGCNAKGRGVIPDEAAYTL